MTMHSIWYSSKMTVEYNKTERSIILAPVGLLVVLFCNSFVAINWFTAFKKILAYCYCSLV